MAECRACLVKNVRMHDATDTRYREMFENITKKKLVIEYGRPGMLCYFCKFQVQKSWKFFEISEKNEENTTIRAVFDAKAPQVISEMYHLSTTIVEAISYVGDGGVEQVPEVTAAIKEASDDGNKDVDQKELSKEDSIDPPQTVETKMTDQAKEITNLEKAEELNNELRSFTRTTESFDTEVNVNTENSNSQNLSTAESPTKEKKNIKKRPKKKKKTPSKAMKEFHKRGTHYYCNKCQYRSLHSKTLNMHFKFHDPKNRFACSFCTYNFPEESELMRHKKYCTVCRICREKFKDLKDLRTHLKLHPGEHSYACDLCDRSFNRKTNLETHLRVHAKDKRYPCENCHKTFRFPSFLKRHMLTHSKKKYLDNGTKHKRLRSGEQPFSCEKCQRFFNQRCDLLTHVERCHPHDPLFTCQICFNTFPMNSELRQHSVMHEVNVETNKELSQYEKEQHNEVMKMKYIFNLGLKPRAVKPQEPDGTIVIPNFNEGGNNVKTSKRKGSFLEPGVAEAKLKPFLPSNTEVNIEATKDINQYNEATYENDYDIEYFDESIGVVEVEISTSEEYTEQEAKNKGITFTHEDLEVAEINLIKKTLAGSEEAKPANKEVLVTEKLEDSSQVLLSDEDIVRNEHARKQSISYTGLDVSAIDPNDLDDFDVDSEKGNIREEDPDLSHELTEMNDDNFEEGEVPSDEIIDLSDAEDKRDINSTPQHKSGNEPNVKLRSDLFVNNNDDKFKVNLNVEINLETNKSMSTVKQGNISTEEACIDLVADTNDDDVEDLISDYATPILERDFDFFQTLHQNYVHKSMTIRPTPHFCELCG